MMEYNKFERQIANTLRQDEVSLDINALIDGIHGNKKKDRKWMLLWFFVIGSILMASGLVYISSSQLQGGSIVDIKENSKAIASSGPNESLIQNIQNQEDIFSDTHNENNQLNSESTNVFANTKNFLKSKSVYKKGKTRSTVQGSSSLKSSLSTTNFIEQQNTSSDIFESDQEIVRTKNDLNPLSNLSSNVLFDRPQVVTDKVVCPTFSSRHRWYIELIPEIGYFRPLKTLENTTGEQNNVFDLRNKNEKRNKTRAHRME